jgi:hypothetical protein
VVRRGDRWLILDGIHRLLKAYQLGRMSVDVRVVSPGDLATIARQLPTSETT